MITTFERSIRQRSNYLFTFKTKKFRNGQRSSQKEVNVPEKKSDDADRLDR
jgi:hypothetical protein